MRHCRGFRAFTRVLMVSVGFAFAAEAEPDSTLLLRLPATEIAKLESDAKSGNVDALYLRSLYLIAKGNGDTAEMGELRERAASAGHPAAQFTQCLLQSITDNGEEPSTKYCFDAAMNGDPNAQSWLALGLNLGMFGLKLDRKSALSFYRQAAFQGHRSALSALGDAYSSGSSVGKDDVLAVHYWERAASLDDASSLRELGRAYALGTGIAPDLEIALRYFNRASDLGDGAAQYYAGHVYRQKGNLSSAHVMFSLAVKNLVPGGLRDAAIKARAEHERVMSPSEMARARAIVKGWRKREPKAQPFIGGIEFIKRLQKALNERGYDVGEADGLAGSKTRTAYKKFAETLFVGEVNFKSPDVYYVGYKLGLFGSVKLKPTAPVTTADKREPAGSSYSEDQASGVTSSGSGFVVNEDGHIVTNAHVVKGCSSVTVVQGLALRRSARILEVSEFTDLAVLKVDEVLPNAVVFRTTSLPSLGESIVVFGYPLIGVLSDQGNLTVGNLTALSGIRGDPSNFQISAPVQPGNSGGPVLDSGGRLIGVVVSKLDALAVAGLTEDIPQNVNFAIKSSVLENLLQSRSVNYRRGGLEASNLTVPQIAEQAKLASVRIECNSP